MIQEDEDAVAFAVAQRLECPLCSWSATFDYPGDTAEIERVVQAHLGPAHGVWNVLRNENQR